MKTKVKEKFSKYGITARMVLLFTMLVIVPYLLLAGLLLMFFRNYTVSRLGEATVDSMASVGGQIADVFREMEEDTMTFYYNGCVELLDKGSAMTEADEEQLEAVLYSFHFSGTGVLAVHIASENGKTYSSGSYAEVISLMEPHREEIVDAGGASLWYSTGELYGRAMENKFILSRSLNSTSRKNVGTLYVVVDGKTVTEVFRQLTADYSVRYFTDGEGNILYSSEKALVGDKLDISAINPKLRSGYQTIKGKSGENMILVSKRIMETGWYCISTISMRDILNSMGVFALPLGVVSVIYILFLMIMLQMMRKYIFRPLGKLKHSMDEYAQGNLESMQIACVGSGELKSLSEHFNHMTLRIDNLMKDYKEEVDEKNRQQMKALTSQLTPHFIYNALNTIKWMAVLNHQEQIQSLVESLIYIFMNAAKVDDENYTVEDELKLVENYAVIQKARFMNFDLIIEKEEACSGLRMKKLLLQPIVENAIVHGLGKGKIQNTEIVVKVWADEILHITVRDEGVGFDVEKWRNCPGNVENHTNIGIGNVEKIIRLEYGEPYGLEIESEPGKGTLVRYSLPVLRKEEKHDPNNYR